VTKATDEQRREWAFLGWWGLSDVAKHARRGNVWRALESLAETRTHAWRLYAADVGVVYPIFGAVSVENAGIPAPEGMSRTLAVADTSSIMDAAREMAEVLEPLAAGLDVSGVRSEAYRLVACCQPFSVFSACSGLIQWTSGNRAKSESEHTPTPCSIASGARATWLWQCSRLARKPNYNFWPMSDAGPQQPRSR
jgi:hypothetical protein